MHRSPYEGANADDSTASTTASSTDGQPQQRNDELRVEACLNNFVQLQLQWQVIWRRKLSQAIEASSRHERGQVSTYSRKELCSPRANDRDVSRRLAGLVNG